jgi:hypothetical protein
MRIEAVGKYWVELSAKQLIDNGGWVAYVAIRSAKENRQAQSGFLSYQKVVDGAVFESEAAAIAGARKVALALVDPVYG